MALLRLPTRITLFIAPRIVHVYASVCKLLFNIFTFFSTFDCDVASFIGFVF